MTQAQGETGIRWLSTLLELQGLSAPVTGEFVADDAGDGSYWLTIDESELTAEQIDVLLGERGNVLDSIQYLANTVLNLGQPPAQQQAYTVELAGYRRRRQTELQAMADEAAAQAQATGEEVELRDLSSAERRQVHNFLKRYPDLETYSRGKEPDRRLVVHLTAVE